MTITVRGVCHCCGGSRKCQASLNGGKVFREIDCPECKGEGVSESQVGLREFRYILEVDARAEAMEMGAGRFEEVEANG
jgi:hypothetical protein